MNGNLAEIENNILSILNGYAGKVPAENYNLWKNFFERIRSDTTMTDAQKKRKYQILTEAIESYNEALYYNSKMNIIKDTLIETTRGIVQRSQELITKFKFALPVALAVAVMVGVYVLKK
jgi:hypothetical protein